MSQHRLGLVSAAVALAAFVSGCGGVPATDAQPTASPMPTVTETVTVTPTPSTIATSGSYKADLAALGVIPDNDEAFADFMREKICERTGEDLGIGVRSSGGNPTGGGIEGVRLTVAYFCPEKSQEVEHYLEYFK